MEVWNIAIPKCFLCILDVANVAVNENDVANKIKSPNVAGNQVNDVLYLAYHKNQNISV